MCVFALQGADDLLQASANPTHDALRLLTTQSAVHMLVCMLTAEPIIWTTATVFFTLICVWLSQNIIWAPKLLEVTLLKVKLIMKTSLGDRGAASCAAGVMCMFLQKNLISLHFLFVSLFHFHTFHISPLFEKKKKSHMYLSRTFILMLTVTITTTFHVLSCKLGVIPTRCAAGLERTTTKDHNMFMCVCWGLTANREGEFRPGRGGRGEQRGQFHPKMCQLS